MSAFSPCNRFLAAVSPATKLAAIRFKSAHSYEKEKV
jgi:hypothetical protein